LPRTDGENLALEQDAGRLNVPAPAKVNLALHVIGRRGDGYHLLESLVAFTRFGDRVTIGSAPSDRFSVTGAFAGTVPPGEGNLVVAARDRLRAASRNQPCEPVSIKLEKNLPVASGIGSGSSDAAATLRALRDFWKLTLSDSDLATLGLRLGADLPMCLAGRPLIASGIGDRIAFVSNFPALHLVLVNPGVPVATPDVFRQLASPDNPGLPPLPVRPSADTIIDWLGVTRNDLEAPALMVAPAIGDVLSALGDTGPRFARMSGSGATCFGLFDDAVRAAEAAAVIHRRHPHWFVVATQSAGVDAHGAS
jgi:4-diphosphocytidyl-2-C-methyl-D-erythritol kinase